MYAQTMIIGTRIKKITASLSLLFLKKPGLNFDCIILIYKPPYEECIIATH
jgi:hypothetical protein